MNELDKILSQNPALLDDAPQDTKGDVLATLTAVDEQPGTSEVHHLVGWGDDNEFISQYVIPRVFGHIVRLAAPVVQEYHSDLYRDAQWLERNVTGPCQMDLVVRHNGTLLGTVGANWNPARSYMQGPSNWSKNDKFYRLDLTKDDRDEWFLTITEGNPYADGAN